MAASISEKLEAQQIEIALARALALAEIGELAAQRHYLGVRGAVTAAALEVLGPGKAVERLELGRCEGQAPVLVLPVECEQPPAERLQLRRRGDPASDEGARPPLGRDAAGERDLARGLGQALGDIA